jgi:hypothetical protein
LTRSLARNTTRTRTLAHAHAHALSHSHSHGAKSAQKWSDVQALELPEAGRAVLRGRRPEEASLILIIPYETPAGRVCRGCVSVSSFHLRPVPVIVIVSLAVCFVCCGNGNGALSITRPDRSKSYVCVYVYARPRPSMEDRPTRRRPQAPDRVSRSVPLLPRERKRVGGKDFKHVRVAPKDHRRVQDASWLAKGPQRVSSHAHASAERETIAGCAR